MTTKPIRVLQFVGCMDYGGVETWLMHVWRHIDRTKFQFDFCYTKPDPGAFAPEIEALGGRMVACPLEKSNPIDFARRFRSLLREGRYDIVHSHVHHFSGFVLRLAHRAGVPMRIAHSHSTSDGKGCGPSRILYRALMKHWIGKYATHGLAASEAAAETLFGTARRSDARFRIMHCGIDLGPLRQEVSREEVRHELGIPLDARVVGHVGSFRPPKNHAFLLQIAAEVLKMRPDVRFLLVGDGPLRPQMEAMARDLGIEKNVIFAGARSDVPRLMLGAMDVFLFPSLWEGLGLAVVEAQAAGLRCLVSDAVPSDAVIVPGLITCLPLSRGVVPWVEVVLRHLDTPTRSPLTALQAVAESDFNIERSCKHLLDLYGRTLAAVQEPSPPS
jgi:glycosyltransferase involved in cell wall biosynthesis